MKKFILLFLILSIIPFSFASWQGNVGLAIFASFGLLAIIYAIAFGFGLDHLKITAREEMSQLIITAVMAGSLVGVVGFIDVFSSQVVSIEGGAGTMQEYALTEVLKVKIIGGLEEDYEKVTNFVEHSLRESTRTHHCQFFSTAFFISACNSFSMVSPPSSIAVNAMAISFVEIQSLYLLTDLGYNYAFAIFLPVGLFLRSLKITRGAGAFFIAIGITLYILLPLTIIFMDDLDEFYQNAPGVSYPETEELSMPDCDPTTTGSGSYGTIHMDNPNEVKKAMGTLLNNNLDSYIYQIFVRVNVTLFVCLTVMVLGIRWLTSAFGAEVDISAISRFM
ncbi:MAG: hypothetical protein PHU63_01725 [Candidatus ainarchaeum sp.]|nr:hypothetical protein [Candidatus ainarchaeum sp.]